MFISNFSTPPHYPLTAFHITQFPSEPSTYKQASTNPIWMEAMTSECNALISNHTKTLCPRHVHHNVVRNKWVFKIKQKPDGSVDRFEARLVAKGFDRKTGIDYHETFSLVVKPTTIRILLALAIKFHWQLKQLDMSNAFLHRVLDDEVYMTQSQGFVDVSYPNYVCRLSNSLYGLKHALKVWFTRLSHALLDIGFIRSQVDYSLFIYHTGSVHIFLLIYVNDVIVIGNHSSKIDKLIAKLKIDFDAKDLGPLNYFLGIQAVRDSLGLHLRQSKFIIDLLCNAPKRLGLGSSIFLHKAAKIYKVCQIT